MAHNMFLVCVRFKCNLELHPSSLLLCVDICVSSSPGDAVYSLSVERSARHLI